MGYFLQLCGFDFVFPGVVVAAVATMEPALFYTSEPIPGRLNRVSYSYFHEPLCSSLRPFALELEGAPYNWLSGRRRQFSQTEQRWCKTN